MLATVVTAKDWRESESDGDGSTLDISKDASHAAKEMRSSARLILNVDGRNPHTSLQLMITIQVTTIGEVRASLNRSPSSAMRLGGVFQLAQSQSSVDRGDEKGAAQSRPRDEYFAMRKTAKFKSNRRGNKEIVERVVACRRARRL